MTDDNSSATVVRAKFAFKGKNNDELTFNKNDTITITQKLDGGWWEGTLNGKTGWFPSNYVDDIKSSGGIDKSSYGAPREVNDANVPKTAETAAAEKEKTRAMFKNMILKSLIDAEKVHVRELLQVFELYLQPLASENIIPPEDYHVLVGNIEMVIQFQSSLLKTLEEITSKPNREQRIGGEFMRLAPTFRSLLKTYCENHPAAVETLNKHRDTLQAFMKSHGAEILTLITGLSRPFRHLDKYPNCLQELERNVEESHPDRGDTQRAISIYRDLAFFCAETRKQKEMQLELTTGIIGDWEGEPLNAYGDIIYMGNVKVLNETSEPDDCCLVMFSNMLLMLQICFTRNTYTFKRKISLCDASVRKLQEVVVGGNFYQNILEFKSKTLANEDISILFSSVELAKWQELFQSTDGVTVDDSSSIISPTTPLQYPAVQNYISPLIKPEVSTMPSPDQAKLSVDAVGQNLNSKRVQSPQMPSPTSSGNAQTVLRSFRALPPQCTNTNNKNATAPGVKLRKKEIAAHVIDKEETELLKLFESYCTSEKAWTVARNMNSPQLIVAEDEKIFVEEVVGDEVIIQEKTLVDTVYTLKDQVSELRQEIKNLTKVVEGEQRARRRLEEILRKQLLAQRNSNVLESKPQVNGNSCNGSNNMSTSEYNGAPKNF